MKFRHFASLLLCGVFATAAADESFEAKRQAALNRKRLVIYNTDGCDITYYPKNLKLTKENFLARRMESNIGSDVDTVSYCALSTGFCTYACKLDSTEMITEGFEMYVPNTRNVGRELLALGTDALTLVQEHCRKHGKEFFIAIRFNDTHDVAGTVEKPHFMMTKFKRNNPDALFGSSGPGKRPPHCAWTAFDYENPKVRELMKKCLKELLEKYDADGIELDFMRHIQLFKSVGWGGEATQEQLDLMTEYVKELRQIIEDAGKKRGRPFIVAIRVPDSVEYCRAVGVDLEKWLAAGVTDLLITSSYFQLNPWQTSVALAKKHNVRFYASLDESRIAEVYLPVPVRNSDASYFARTLSAMESGADGVYFFNKEGSSIKRLMTTNKERLRTPSKVYYVRVRGSGGYQPDHYLRNGSRFNNLPDLEPHEPKIITQKEPYAFPLFIGDDLSLPEVSIRKPKVTVFFAADAPQNAQLSIKVNGQIFSTVREGNIFSALIPAELIKKGFNNFEIAIAGEIDYPMVRSVNLYRGTYPLTGRNQKFWRRLFDYESKKAEFIVNGACRIKDYADDVSPNFIHPMPKRNGVFAVGFTMKNDPGSAKDTVVVRVAAGRKVETVSFEPDKITFKNAGKSVKFNTADKFHRYLFTSVDGKNIRLIADKKTLMTAPFETTTYEKGKNLVGAAHATPWMDSDSVLFGSLAAAGQGSADWKDITVADGTIVVRDFAMTIDFDDGRTELASKIAAAPKTAIAELSAKDGKLVSSKNLRIRYDKEAITPNGSSIALDHTSTVNKFQNVEIIPEKWMNDLDRPLIISWKMRETEPSKIDKWCFQVVATVKVKGNFYETVVRCGQDRILLPWNRQVIIPGGSRKEHEYTVAFDPATGGGMVWIDGKLIGTGEIPVNNQRTRVCVNAGDGSGSVSGKVELYGFKAELEKLPEPADIVAPLFNKPAVKAAGIDVKDGKIMLDKVRNRYNANPAVVSGDVIMLDHTAVEKPATFQHFEIIPAQWMKKLDCPVVLKWNSAEIETSAENKHSSQITLTANVPDKGYFDITFSVGKGKVLTPWRAEIAIPGDPAAMHSYTAIFDPATLCAALWIDGKLAGGGKLKANPNRVRAYGSIGDGSGNISGKVKLSDVQIKLIR